MIPDVSRLITRYTPIVMNTICTAAPVLLSVVPAKTLKRSG